MKLIVEMEMPKDCPMCPMRRRRKENGMISDKKAIEAAETISHYCEEQRGCQNCIFRKSGTDHWKCEIQAFELRNILANKEAKSKNHGYI